MEEEMGLAGSVPGPAAGVDPGGMSIPADDMAMLIEEVINLLRDGITPEELLEVGVPRDIIDQAIAALEAEMAGAPMQQPPSTQAGLAETMM